MVVPGISVDDLQNRAATVHLNALLRADFTISQPCSNVLVAYSLFCPQVESLVEFLDSVKKFYQSVLELLVVNALNGSQGLLQTPELLKNGLPFRCILAGIMEEVPNQIGTVNRLQLVHVVQCALVSLVPFPYI